MNIYWKTKYDSMPERNYMGIYREDVIRNINAEFKKLKKSKHIVAFGLGVYAEKVVIESDFLNYGEIEYVDSVRNGLFLGKQIIKPNEVRWESVDAVVILSVLYADEIERNLKNKYGFEKLIIKLSSIEHTNGFYKLCSKNDLIPQEEIRACLEKNRILKDIAKGKKCFILGNGPSIKEYDLGLIDNDDSVVFAVNQFFKINKAKVDYCVIADPRFFSTKEEDFVNDYYSNLNEIKNKNRTIGCLFPVRGKEFVEQKLFDCDNVYYFDDSDRLSRTPECEIDLTQKIPARHNVVQYAIQIALYMGVKSIYLLGCEETGMFGALRNYLDEGYDEHAYEVSEKQKQAYRDYLSKTIPIEVLLESFSNVFMGYKQLNDICLHNGVKLYTCAEKTLVRGVDYISFENAIHTS